MLSTAILNITPHTTYQVEVPVGAAEALVACKQLVNVYQVNPEIKTFSIFFLLRRVTTANKIQNWHKQKDFLLSWCGCNENTFRAQLKKLQTLGLIGRPDKKRNNNKNDIHLGSLKDAARALQISWRGTQKIDYNPIQNNGKQVFQYQLRAEEIKVAQQRQLNGLIYHLDKNPLLKNELHQMLVKYGADVKMLSNPSYFQARLLQLQMIAFREGSEISELIHAHRADINRSVNSIKEHHSYKTPQSVSYMKKVMQKLGLIQIKKLRVESKTRSRLYVPDGDRKRDGYKWVLPPIKTKNGGFTVWFLCDQITFNPTQDETKKLAA
jgi:hypothetical protein